MVLNLKTWLSVYLSNICAFNFFHQDLTVFKFEVFCLIGLWTILNLFEPTYFIFKNNIFIRSFMWYIYHMTWRSLYFISKCKKSHSSRNPTNEAPWKFSSLKHQKHSLQIIFMTQPLFNSLCLKWLLKKKSHKVVYRHLS